MSIKSLSISTGSACKSALMVRSRQDGRCILHHQHTVRINFSTPDHAPFMTLVVSDMKAMQFEISNPLLVSDSLRASKRFRAVPMLTIGMSRGGWQRSNDVSRDVISSYLKCM